MTKLAKLSAWLLAIGLICGGSWGNWGDVLTDYGRQAWQWGEYSATSKPIAAVVVRESSNPLALSKAQTAWIMSPKLRADCRAAKIEFDVIDPDVKERDGKTPAKFAAIIAKAKTLPRLILVGPRGGLTDFVLPVDEAAARSRIGLGG